MATNEYRDRPSAVTGAQRDRPTEWTDDRDLSDDDNLPPNHGKVTTPGSSARFLQWVGRVHPDVDIDELPDLFEEWRERRNSGEQADLSGWDK